MQPPSGAPADRGAASINWGARGAALIALAALLFAVMAALAKRAAGRLPGPEVAFVRFAVGLVACGVVAVRRPFVARNWTGLFLRGAFGGVAVLFYFLAIEHLPVGFATLLNYTAPVFTAVWASIFLAERTGARAVLALVVTTLGVATVVFGNRASAPPGTFGFGPWQLVGVLSAALSGAAVATIREVRKTDGSWEIFAAFCVVGVIATAPMALESWVSPTPIDWLLLAGVGLTSVVAQVLYIYALRYVAAATSGVISQLTPVTALLLGVLVLGDSLTLTSLLGSAVTLAGVALGARRSEAPRT
jgi:drug/metabolite transporter (DMT)-like permease